MTFSEKKRHENGPDPWNTRRTVGTRYNRVPTVFGTFACYYCAKKWRTPHHIGKIVHII
jgi:hypothetical protein